MLQKAQLRPKMARDRVKMAKMGGDQREVSGRSLKMRRMSLKMRLKIVTKRFRSDFRGQDEKRSAPRVRGGVPPDGMRGPALDYV